MCCCLIMEGVKTKELPQVIELDKAGSNSVRVQIRALEMLHCLDASHLASKLFSVSTEKRPEGDKVEQLRQKQIVDRRTELLRLYPNVEQKVERDKAIEDYIESWGRDDGTFLVGAEREVFYIDPTSDQVEGKLMRDQRTAAWNWYARALVHYPLIMGQVESHNWAELHRRVGDVFGGDRPTRMVADSAAVAKLRKKQGQPAAPFVEEVLRLYDSIKGQSNARYRMPPGFLPVHVLTALGGDPDYSYQTEELRKLEQAGGVSIEEIVAAITTRSGQLKVMPGGVKQLVGGAAAMDTPMEEKTRTYREPTEERRQHMKKLPCFHWRDYGKCKFGDKCKFSHAAKFKGKGKDKGKDKDTCIECGSEDHGYTDCSERKKREQRAIDEKSKSEVESLSANMASMSAAMTAMQERLDSGSESGIIRGHAARLRDPYSEGGELSTLFVPRDQ